MAKDFIHFVGMEQITVSEGNARAVLDLRPEHMSPANRVHGGVLFTLLDTVMGRALLTVLPAGQGCATLEIKMNFFRPIQLGRVTAEARLVNLTRRTAYLEGELTTEEGKVLARGSATFFITETRDRSERERI